MDLVHVLYLPPYPPSISYRPWAYDDHRFSPMRWLVELLVPRCGSAALLVACQDEADRQLAELVTSDLQIFVTVCAGRTLLEALGEIARAFPSSPIAYFHTEMIFAPSDILDRVCEHHKKMSNGLTYISDLPPLLGPEVADSALLRSLAQIPFDGRPPTPREAVLKLMEIRSDTEATPRIQAEPFTARSIYSVPEIGEVTPFQTRSDVERARKAVEGLCEPHQFEAVERWRAASFDPPAFVWRPEACRGTGPDLLYLSSGSLYSGAEECLRGLAEGLGELGFRQTAVIGVEGLLTCRLREAGCQIISPNWDFGGSRVSQGVPREDEAHRQFAESVLDAVRPTYIHCNSDPGQYFTQDARARSIPIVFHARTCTFTRMEAVLAESTHVISVSEFVKRRLIQFGIPPSKITVVYDGINPERLSRKHFSRSEMRRRFELPDDTLVILMVARASPQKRHDLMLDAFAELCQVVDGARLVFVTDAGPDETITQARRKVAELGLETKIHWLPFQDDIRQIESAADVIVLPSDGEALGTCILEGMSLELPVVVSDSGGAHELIEEGISGLSFRGGDAKALARVLCRLAGSPGLRAGLGREARRRIEQRFTLRHHAEQVAAVLARTRAATG